MTGCMPKCRLDDDGPIAEHIMLIALENESLAVPERCIARRLSYAGRPRGEHRVALVLPHEPGGGCEFVRVSGVIVMVVRKGEVGYVGRRIAQLSQLNLQRFDHRHVTFLRVREHNMLHYGSASR